MKSINSLKQYLKANYPTLTYFLIEDYGKYGSDGFGLEKSGNSFIWFYYEKNERQNLEYFETEETAVAFALKEIQIFISNQ